MAGEGEWTSARNPTDVGRLNCRAGVTRSAFATLVHHAEGGWSRAAPQPPVELDFGSQGNCPGDLPGVPLTREELLELRPELRSSDYEFELNQSASACHRAPDARLRDPALVTDLDWAFEGTPEEEAQYRAYWKELHQIQPSQDCSTCHR